jgi:hypothetical protein
MYSSTVGDRTGGRRVFEYATASINVNESTGGTMNGDRRARAAPQDEPMANTITASKDAARIS